MFLLIFKKSWLISKLESDKIKIESDSLQVNAGINIFDWNFIFVITVGI